MTGQAERVGTLRGLAIHHRPAESLRLATAKGGACGSGGGMGHIFYARPRIIFFQKGAKEALDKNHCGVIIFSKMNPLSQALSQPPKTQAELADALGVSVKGLHTWVKRGLLSPHDPGLGRGNQHQWSWRNVFEALLIKHLKGRGIKLTVISALMDQLHERERQDGKSYLPTVVEREDGYFLDGFANGSIIICQTITGKHMAVAADLGIKEFVEKGKPGWDWDEVLDIHLVSIRHLVRQTNLIMLGL